MADAVRIAREAHERQVGKAGKPYLEQMLSCLLRRTNSSPNLDGWNASTQRQSRYWEETSRLLGGERKHTRCLTARARRSKDETPQSDLSSGLSSNVMTNGGSERYAPLRPPRENHP